MLATITVNDPGDFFDTDPNVTTLREAVFAAEQFPDLDTINFTSNLNGATIALMPDQPLSITRSVQIEVDLTELPLGVTVEAYDPTPNSTPLDANSSDDGDGSSVFSITAQADNTAITLAGLTITGGDTGFSIGGGVDYNSYAFNCSLTIRNCKVVENFTAGEGAGVFATGPQVLNLEIVETTISGNASFAGGGIDAHFALAA